MVPQILASIDFVAFMPFIVAIVIIVMLFRYHLGKKQLEHQQIMAAIEKGTPLSDLRPVEQKKKEVDWIKSLTVGIAFLLMGMGMAIIVLSDYGNLSKGDGGLVLLCAAVVFLAIGAAGTIRGILQRKTEKALSSDKSALDANHGQ